VVKSGVSIAPLRAVLLGENPSPAIYASIPILPHPRLSRNARAESIRSLLTTWRSPPRLPGVIPLGYVAQWNRNTYWSIVVHCTFNARSMVMLFALVGGVCRALDILSIAVVN
jgi:hypothetical protein